MIGQFSFISQASRKMVWLLLHPLPLPASVFLEFARIYPTDSEGRELQQESQACKRFGRRPERHRSESELGVGCHWFIPREL